MNLNKKNIRILDEMIEIAKKGNHRSKHAAAIVHSGKGKILYSAENRVLGLGNGLKTKHAEANVIGLCLAQNKNKQILRGKTLYVIRINPNFNYDTCNFVEHFYDKKNNPFQNSKPCPKCQSLINKCIDKYGLKGVVYT